MGDSSTKSAVRVADNCFSACARFAAFAFAICSLREIEVFGSVAACSPALSTLDKVLADALDVLDLPSDDVFENVGDILFGTILAPVPPWLSSGIEGLRKSPLIDARGLSGLALSVLLPDAIEVALVVFLIVVGGFPLKVEVSPDDCNFEGVEVERKFALLFDDLKGAFSVFGAVVVLGGVSVIKDDFGGRNVFVDARKSIGIAFPVYPLLELGREVTDFGGGIINVSG
jgi:hypothetical protein